MSHNLPTEPYKGTRDFYPPDMAVLRYIFDTWSKTAESFGYERYDASLLEPAELYRTKTSEEIVNEQTYTFTDRGDREVTLRPEMTPSVARMVAAKRRELSFPLRWYSIPNLFRYERPQRGRLREHWQLNCDIFGEVDSAADIELVSLAHRMITAFGATGDMFTIELNDRALMEGWYRTTFGLDDDGIKAITRIVDRKKKMGSEEFRELARSIISDVDTLIQGLESNDPSALGDSSRIQGIMLGLRELGISNMRFNAALARGFDYYTGMVFEIFDTSSENNRSMLGGGRYDNLSGLFGGEPIPGLGFGMGDVVMQDFLQTHALLPGTVRNTAATLLIVPTDTQYNVEALKIASPFREHGIRTSVDTSDRKLGKKIGNASDKGIRYVLVVGQDELRSQSFELKDLIRKESFKGQLDELIRTFG